MKQTKGKPEYYRWILAIACFFAFSLCTSLGFNCWSVFTIPICEDLSLSRQQFSGLFTTFLVAQTVGALITDSLVKRLGLMRFMRLGVLLGTAMFALTSQVRSVYGFYAVGFLLGISLATCTFLPISVIIANWFVSLRGVVTGFVFMGSGLLSTIFVPRVNSWITLFGWRRTILIMASIMGSVAVPLIFFVIKATPQDVGLVPYLVKTATEASNTALEENNWGYSAKELVGQPVFWLFAFFTLCIYAETNHSNTVVPYLTDVGYDAGFASNVWAACMGFLALCRVALGYISDKLGVFRTVRLFSLMAPLMMVGLLLSPAAPTATALIVAGVGTGESLSVVCFPIIIGRLFGRKHYTQVYGILNAIGSMVSAAIPVLYGLIYTQTGAYTLSYQIFGAVYLLGTLGLFAALRLHEKRRT